MKITIHYPWMSGGPCRQTHALMQILPANRPHKIEPQIGDSLTKQKHAKVSAIETIHSSRVCAYHREINWILGRRIGPMIPHEHGTPLRPRSATLAVQVG